MSEPAVEPFAYTPTNWQDGVTPTNAANLNKIETELALLDGRMVADPAGLSAKWLRVSGGAMAWVDPNPVVTQAVSSDPADIALAAGGGTTVVLETTGTGGVMRSVQNAFVATGSRLTIRCGSTGAVTIRHNYAGVPPGGYAKFLTIGAADIVLAANSGQTASFYYNGTWWIEVDKDVGASGGGGGLDWEGAWSSSFPYVAGDVVTYNGVVYGAVNPGTNQTPPAASQFPVANIPVSLVTALPTTGLFDGMVVDLTDSLTAPTFTWRLRYVAAKSTNKWVFVGGPEIFGEVATGDENCTSASYAPLATAGPVLTVPVAGDYVIDLGCYVNPNGDSGTRWGSMSYDIGATPASDNDCVIGGYYSNSANLGYMTVMRRRKKTFTAVTLTAKYRIWQGGGALFGARWMSLKPVAVGG